MVRAHLVCLKERVVHGNAEWDNFDRAVGVEEALRGCPWPI